MINPLYNSSMPRAAIKTKLERYLPYLLVGGGSVGLWASFQLMLERLEIAKNPNFVPSCDINPVVACGSVIKSLQAEAFGFPNPIIGLVGFAVVATVGMGLLA